VDEVLNGKEGKIVKMKEKIKGLKKIINGENDKLNEVEL
jgi:F0F1-type ATP synthase beta subunit